MDNPFLKHHRCPKCGAIRFDFAKKVKYIKILKNTKKNTFYKKYILTLANLDSNLIISITK